MGDEVPIGSHNLFVEVTLNGQQYTENGNKFSFSQVDPKMTDEDLKKLDEEENKNLKKGPAKNKSTIETVTQLYEAKKIPNFKTALNMVLSLAFP